MDTTVTFITTDKNPAVVFPTSPPPDYGGSPDPAGYVHSIAFSDESTSGGSGPDYGNQATTEQDVKTAAITGPPPITVIVKPSAVVIDSQTFTDNPAQPTSTVVVNSNTFIINPTQVDGVGATITRPPSGSGGGVAAPSPTKTTIGGISVDIEGSSVILDSTTFTIGPKPTTVVVKGQTITLGPGGVIFPSQTLGGIVFPSQTLIIPAAQDTIQMVFGAELITAIGSNIVVIEGKTITYEPGSSTITEVIDGDTVLIGPSGIIAHGQTYGGSNAASTETQFAVVGGATISQIGPTAVVIQGVTYTLNPLATGQSTGQTQTTTVVGGETITIGPEGVAISTWTFTSPYVSTTTITPSNGPSHGAVVALPMPTATNSTKKNGSPSSASKRPSWALSACLATGAGVLGALLAL
ncbi:hypothetical protein HD806DRAFT_181017 [Xylariaceae sp. AK1471]|nr:hypothetical protein HD806DRAFT_181017 [Xylariaceae sp. AK1471]